MSDSLKPVSEQELEVAYAGPALAANRFYVTVGPSWVRIAFAEQCGSDKASHFRTAVILSVQDGVALRDLISKLVKDAGIGTPTNGGTG